MLVLRPIIYIYIYILFPQHFMPLANLQCSPEAHLFLCQAFVPECIEPTFVVSPCRELCERVHSDCAADMQVFGLSWPPELQCERYVLTHLKNSPNRYKLP